MIPRLLIITTNIDPRSGQSAALTVAGGIDGPVAWALAHNLHPIVVLGADGDDLLRVSRRLHDCELVFNPNEQLGFLASLKAGLSAVGEPAYFCAAEAPPVGAPTWGHYMSVHDNHLAEPYHLLSEAPDQTGLAHAPGLVTRRGVAHLAQLSVHELALGALEIRSQILFGGVISG